MKITKVEAFPLMAPINDLEQVPVSVPRPEATGSLIFAGYRALLVRIETDEGLIGAGEGLVRLAPRATAAIVDDLAGLVVGRNPEDVDVIWEDLFSTMANRGHNRGFMLEAISAIDIALWDLLGKASDKSVATLLGGVRTADIPCYASSLRIKDPKGLEQDAIALREDGHEAIKLKIGRGPGRIAEDLESVQLVRDVVGPDVTLMVDANCGYDLADAVRIAKGLERLEVAWFEEPLPPDALDDYALLRQKVDVPIAAGETWFTCSDFREALRREAVDIVQPDVSRCGGISEARKIAWLADAFNKRYAPHTGQSSVVCLTASIHMAASMSNASIYEYVSADWSSTTPNPLRTTIGRPGLESLREGGVVRLPTEPGLGIEIDWNEASRYLV